MKIFSLLTVFLISLHPALSQIYPAEEVYITLPYTINEQDTSISFRYVTNYKNNKKLKSYVEYFWLLKGDIHHTQGDFEGRLLHGTYCVFSPTNQLLEKGNMNLGLKEGFWKKWHNNGQLKEVVYWKKGKKKGKCFRYNSSGEIISIGKYVNNKLHGKKKIFENGKIVAKEYYKDGKLKVKKVRITENKETEKNKVRKVKEKQPENEKSKEKEDRQKKLKQKKEERKIKKAERKAQREKKKTERKSKKENKENNKVEKKHHE